MIYELSVFFLPTMWHQCSWTAFYRAGHLQLSLQSYWNGYICCSESELYMTHSAITLSVKHLLGFEHFRCIWSSPERHLASKPRSLKRYRKDGADGRILSFHRARLFSLSKGSDYFFHHLPRWEKERVWTSLAIANQHFQHFTTFTVNRTVLIKSK